MRSVIVLLLFSASAIAQPDGLTGTVAGHVYCADTQHPARLTHISLVPLPPAVAAPAATPPHVPQHFDGQTRSDGSFLVTHVPPGDYYVSVTYSGYLSPEYQFSAHDLLQPTAEIRKQISESVPVVLVAANRTANVSVSIHRGASISGTLRYEDGSPVPEAGVVALHRDANGKWVKSAPPVSENRLFADGLGTDDLGRFRIPALAPGEYTLEVPTDYVFGLDAVYYGDVFFAKDAKSIKLTDSQEYSDADITIRLSKLHTISGSLVNSTGQPVNSGKVTLYTPDNIAIAGAQVDEDGATFYIDLVPSGAYTLRVAEAKSVKTRVVRDADNPDMIGDIKRTTLATYSDYEMPLEINSDIAGLTVTISDKK